MMGTSHHTCDLQVEVWHIQPEYITRSDGGRGAPPSFISRRNTIWGNCTRRPSVVIGPPARRQDLPMETARVL